MYMLDAEASPQHAYYRNRDGLESSTREIEVRGIDLRTSAEAATEQLWDTPMARPPGAHQNAGRSPAAHVRGQNIKSRPSGEKGAEGSTSSSPQTPRDDRCFRDAGNELGQKGRKATSNTCGGQNIAETTGQNMINQQPTTI